MESNSVKGQGEAVLETQELLTLSIAEGAVDPAQRIAGGEMSAQKMNELLGRLQSREFITRADPEAIPCDCMDCRGQTNGRMVIGPKAAGGTDTCVIADALTSNSYRHPGEKAPTHKRRMLGELQKAGHRVGGHTATGVTVPGYAGCGAEDKLDGREPGQPSILHFLERKQQPTFAILRSLVEDGISVELEDTIVANAGQLRQEGYATTGAELSQAGVEVAGEASVKVLDGPQRGVAVVILTRPGEVLDQQKIADEYGPAYQVFEIAAWAVANGAKATSLSPQEAHQKYVAGMAFNLAAGGVIAGPSMPVVIL